MAERLYTTAQAADKLGLAPRTVRKAAEDLGLGKMLTPRFRLLSTSDIRCIQANRRPVGRPALAV